jgi:RNA polymerase sigma-70 factor, ECF subfamily
LELEDTVRAQRGDRQAQQRVLAALGPLLASLVRRLGDRKDPEDQLQELFAHVLSVLPKFDPAGPATLSTWAYTVAMRQLLMEKRRPALELVAIEGGLSVPDARPAIDERLHAERRRAQLEAAVMRLPEDQRAVFVGAQLQQQPLEAVAAALELPLGTVKSRLHRAKAQLVLWLNPPAPEQQKGASRAEG